MLRYNNLPILPVSLISVEPVYSPLRIQETEIIIKPDIKITTIKPLQKPFLIPINPKI